MVDTKKKRTILVADDDAAIVDSLKMILELSDYHVEAIGNGKVLPLAKKIHPDLLILDIWMSGMDGREICQEWKRDPQLRSIPVILISASRDIAKSSKLAGADNFIEKPFDMDYLLHMIEKYVN